MTITKKDLEPLAEQLQRERQAVKDREDLGAQTIAVALEVLDSVAARIAMSCYARNRAVKIFHVLLAAGVDNQKAYAIEREATTSVGFFGVNIP